MIYSNIFLVLLLSQRITPFLTRFHRTLASIALYFLSRLSHDLHRFGLVTNSNTSVIYSSAYVDELPPFPPSKLSQLINFKNHCFHFQKF